MTVRGERPGARRLHFDGKGLTGEIRISCDWSDVDPAPVAALPQYGEVWSADLPYLVCVEVDAQEGSIAECEYVARYSTDRQIADEFYESSWDWDLEVIDCTKGFTWRDAGTPVTIDIPTVVPVASYRLTFKRELPPDDVIDSALGKLNDRKFHGCATGTLRFDGCGTDESYAADGSLISVRTVYKFTKKTRSHNEAWREPLQARDLNGDLIYYQNIDAGEPYYTVDATLIGTPVWVSGTAGTGAWDEPQDSDTDPRYESCNFASVLDIPIKSGDDAEAP
jgi:hypothetical protein